MLSSQAARIGAAAIKQRLPSVSSGRDHADGGLLLSYGPNFFDAYVRAATYVDKILRGARPADLPVEQGTKFDLVVNARTARLLGVTIPRSVIVRADEVLE
jgi:putative tryptophan/tyrosine transport system substrate-binding protein